VAVQTPALGEHAPAPGPAPLEAQTRALLASLSRRHPQAPLAPLAVVEAVEAWRT
jgi:hypothetical protein